MERIEREAEGTSGRIGRLMIAAGRRENERERERERDIVMNDLDVISYRLNE